jgi:transglutaminase-like putative cysteine protease
VTLDGYPATVPHTLSSLPEGVDAVRATLRLMVKLARTYRADVGIIETAQRVTAGLPSKDYRGEIRALHVYVRDRVRYVRDPRGVEKVQSPKRTLEIGSGDCDDKATLLAALLESIGFATRYVGLGFNDGPYSHVILEVRLGTRWEPLETTVAGAEAGWAPPNPTRRMVAHI